MSFRLMKYAPKRGVNRKAGECDQLLNSTPMRIDGSEVKRFGYSDAGLPDFPSGVTVDYIRYASTENPSAKDVLFLFGHTDTRKRVFMYSWIAFGDTNWTDEWREVAVNLFGFPSWTRGTHTATISGLSITTNDYYAGWILHNANQNRDAYVTGNVGNVLTVLETLDSGTPWLTSDSLELYQWFHGEYSTPFGGVQFSYPTIKTDAGVFKIGLGRGSLGSFKPLKVGNINKTFFPKEAQALTYKGTYASTRELLPPDPSILSQTFDNVDSSVALPDNSTVWLAVAAVYSGQIGSLRKFETPSFYTGGTNQNFIATGQHYNVNVGLHSFVSKLNKFVDGYNLYMAIDIGDTRTIGRKTPYYFIRDYPIVGEMDATLWTYGYLDGAFSAFPIIYAIDWQNKGSSFAKHSGYIDGVDTMYSYDLEAFFGGRSFLGRVHKYTENRDDLDVVYTNPRNEDGIIQTDVFSDEPDAFTSRVLWGDSSYITGIAANDRGRLLVLKDRAIVDFGITELSDGTIGFQPSIVSTQTGCTGIDAYVVTPNGIFFTGYDGIYLYDGKLHDLTLDDWENVYRTILSTTKNNNIVWYRPEDKAFYAQISSIQYSFFPDKGWRQNTYANTLASLTVKRDNTVIFLSSGIAYKFDSNETDAGTEIPVKWKTGYMRATEYGTIGDFLDAFINKKQVASSGTLDCNIKFLIDGVEHTVSLTGLDKSKTRLKLPISIGTNSLFDYVSIEYNVGGTPETGLIEFNEVELNVVPERKLELA